LRKRRERVKGNFYIRIDKGTLRKNPHAGEPYYVPGRATEEEGARVIQQVPFYEIGSKGQPSYFFEYVKDFAVQCWRCLAYFPWGELGNIPEEWDDAGNYFPGVDNICPKCGEERCCELTFETVREALGENEDGG